MPYIISTSNFPSLSFSLCPGQEDYDRLRPFSYSDVDVVLICFSLADQDTLTNVVDNWSPEIRYFCGDVPVILVGNKKDLREAESSLTSSKRSLVSEYGGNEDIHSEESQTEGSCDRSKTDNSETNAPRSTPEASQESGERDVRHGSISPSLKVCSDGATGSDIVRPVSSLYVAKPVFHASAPVKHSEGVQIARRIGAMAYFETSALTGDNVEELLLATTKAAVLGAKKSKKFKPFTNTMASWKSLGALASK